MRGVKAVDVFGKTVWRVWSVTEAAILAGVSETSVILGIKRGTVRNGLKLEYDEDLHQKMEWAKMDVAVKAGAGKDCMTDVDVEREVRAHEALGIHLERVRYELMGGVVTVSPCMKLDWEKRVRIGSLGCVMCSYFRGRNRKSQEVLCIHRSKMLKEGERKRGKKAGGKEVRE